ncbi:MAG: hypothetical protein AAB606_02470 [Patescibacteria group bacterium]
MDFYKEFKNLLVSKPRNATSSRTAENCEFSDYVYLSKNIYLSYFITECEDCYYSEYLTKCRDCVDCAHLGSCELSYQCVDCSGLYGCSHLQDCHNCSNCDFCTDCLNCKDCFGSFGLRQQKFCIFNKSYPEDVYRKRVAEFKKNTPKKIIEVLTPQFNKHPRLYARMLKGGEHCFGDYIYFSKNCFQCFSVRNVSDSAYVSHVNDQQTSSADNVDCDFCSGIELCYECHNVNSCNNCSFVENCIGCSDSTYCLNCYNCRSCLGCTYLMNKEYCILNRQFTRDEYLAASAKIIKDLKEAKVYGKSLAETIK